MRNDQIFVLLLVVLLPLSGCFGGVIGDAEADDDDSDDDHTQWINDVGISPISWNLTLNQNQWLEVKSAVGLLTTDSNNSDEETNQIIVGLPIFVEYVSVSVSTSEKTLAKENEKKSGKIIVQLH